MYGFFSEKNVISNTPAFIHTRLWHNHWTQTFGVISVDFSHSEVEYFVYLTSRKHGNVSGYWKKLLRKGFDRSFTVLNSTTPVGFWILLESCHGWTKTRIYAEFPLQNGSESRSVAACLRTECFGDFITDRPTGSTFLGCS